MKFVEKERNCETAFNEYAPFWHVYTDGRTMGDIFCTEEDFKIGMTVLAVCATVSSVIDIITFELMNNHLHLIMRGSQEECMDFFTMYKKRLRRLYMKMGRVVDWENFQSQILQIETLRALRNEIIYVNRNAFVANYKYTPFNYPWGGGWAYFSPVIYMLPVKSAAEVGSCRMRELTHYRDIADLETLKFIGEVPFIPSFCRVDIGEMMFQNARSYFNSLTRNAEAFSQIASRIGDSVFMTDDEMFVIAAKCAAEMFAGVPKLSMLTFDQKKQLACRLHFDYNATNQQLRRLLKLDLSLLNEMFPQPGS